MSVFFKSDGRIISLITAVFAALTPVFFLRQGLLLIDTGREFYIPMFMRQGGVLYKDIYNIYGTLSYQINSFLFSIFGEHINVLYFAGIVNSLIIVISCYLISREFLEKNLSFLISILIMSALVFRTFLYNSVLTYSFAIVYALSAFLLSVLFLIKYLKSGNKNSAYLSCLFAGISISSKYEFTLYIFVLAASLISAKKLGMPDLLKAAGAFACVPVLSYGVLLLQGFNLSDLKITYNLFQNLINAPLLKLFFGYFGVFPSVKGLMLLIFTNKIFAVFALLPILSIIMFINQIKEIYKNKPLFVFLLCSFSACAKNFFYLNVNHMGVFLFPISAIAAVILLKKYLNKFLSAIICFCIFIFAADDFASLKYKNYLLETPKGSIYTYKKDGEPIKYSLDFILNNTNKNDRVVILPEGSFINFASGRKGDLFYYNLSPLFYNDVFKPKNVISHFEENMPEYFILLPIDNSEYGSAFFGIDYAGDFYEIIVNNCNLIEEKNNIKIFKRKNI